MNRRAAALAAVVHIGALGLGACTRQTELLPLLLDGSALPLCPLQIDVYGADDALFSACGGPPRAPASRLGRFAPGTADFDATLAGRLQLALGGDAALTARFGGSFRVRDCGASGAWLSSLAPMAVADECAGPEAPPETPAVAESCADQPAPVALVIAAEPLDRCHGGGADSPRADDPAGYAAHFAARLEALLVARAPTLAIVGGQTGWTPLPGASQEDPAACGWRRGDWSRDGLAAWSSMHPGRRVIFAGDLHDEFKRRSRCCQALGLPCDPPTWLAAAPVGDPSPPPVSCEGARRIAAWWVAVVRSALSSTRFVCEK